MVLKWLMPNQFNMGLKNLQLKNLTVKVKLCLFLWILHMVNQCLLFTQITTIHKLVLKETHQQVLNLQDQTLKLYHKVYLHLRYSHLKMLKQFQLLTQRISQNMTSNQETLLITYFKSIEQKGSRRTKEKWDLLLINYY